MPALSSVSKIKGKFQAFKTLTSFAVHLKNWPQVFSAYRKNRTAPPLVLRSGISIYHGSTDDVWSLFTEIFVQRCYTGRHFYAPRPGDSILDCGANIGFFALYLASRSAGLKIHCFEPATATRKRLELNIEKNALKSEIKTYPFAIFDGPGTLSLAITASAGDTSSFTSASESEKVECISLSAALQLTGNHSIALLKMDVEGAEIEILEAADATTLKKIQRIALEYHNGIRPDCLERLKRKLTQHYAHVESWPTTPNGQLGILHAWN